MNGDEFVKWVRREAKRRGLPNPELDVRRGKGSHAALYVGERFTILKDRRKEIGPGLLRSMKRDLGLD